MNENNILEENQAGFRKHYSTTDHIFTMNCIIEILRNQKKKIFCAFIDFSKAFDSVWRLGMWKKLLKYNIKGNFFKVIYNLYQNTKSCVQGDNMPDVPQGQPENAKDGSSHNANISEFFTCNVKSQTRRKLIPNTFFSIPK